MVRKSRRQHYVPQFYLRGFATGDKTIGMYRVSDGLHFDGAGIKEQAYRPNFYGEDGKLEREFQKLESEFAPVLAEIRETRELPSRGSESYTLLLIFVAIQHLRTPTAGQRTSDAILPMLNRFADEVLSSKGIDSQDVDFEMLFPHLIGLGHLDTYATGLSDLEPLLLAPPRGHRFVTSDNPVIFYNAFCEGVDYKGVTGIACSGLQVAVPIGPRIALFLHDPTTYELRGKRASPYIDASKADVRQLNLLQTIGADQVAFFSDTKVIAHLNKLRRRALHLREQQISYFEEYEGIGGQENETVYQAYSRQRDIGLTLSFAQVRPALTSLPIRERGRMMRPIHGWLQAQVDGDTPARHPSARWFRRVASESDQ